MIAAAQLLDGGDPPEAVVCANDETALGLMIGALGRGVRVPDDLAITGFDDMPMASLVTPELTTIRQPVRELAHDHGPSSSPTARPSRPATYCCPPSSCCAARAAAERWWWLTCIWLNDR